MVVDKLKLKEEKTDLFFVKLELINNHPRSHGPDALLHGTPRLRLTERTVWFEQEV